MYQDQITEKDIQGAKLYIYKLLLSQGYKRYAIFIF